MEKTTPQGALCSVLLNKYYTGDEIKKSEMGRACGTYEVEERCIQGLAAEIWEKRDHLEDTGIDGSLEWILKQSAGVDWIDLVRALRGSRVG